MSKRMTDPKETPAASPWAKTKPKPTLNYGANASLTTTMAVSFIISQLKPKPPELRAESDRVHKRIKYALEHGHLRQDIDGRILFGDLIAWGLEKSDWRVALAGFPTLRYASGSGNMAPLFGQAHGYTVPVGEQAKDAALRESMAQIQELKNVIQTQDAELAQLRPLDKERRRLAVVAQKAGLKGGRPRKR